MKLRTFAVIALALAACGAQGAEKYYKWKDEGGAWHYTRTPPPAGAQSENVEVHGAPPSSGAATPVATTASASPAAGGTATNTVASGASMPSDATRKAQCEQARALQATLNDNQFVAVDRDNDGNPELLSEEEKRREAERVALAVKLACE